jgi:hypothetical protein
MIRVIPPLLYYAFMTWYKCFQVDQITGYEMGGTCSRHWEKTTA